MSDSDDFTERVLTLKRRRSTQPLPTEFVIRELLELEAALVGPLHLDGRLRGWEAHESVALLDFMATWGHVTPERSDANPIGTTLRVPEVTLSRHFHDAFTLSHTWLDFFDDDYIEPRYFESLPDLRHGITGEQVAWEKFAAVLSEGLQGVPPRATHTRSTGQTVDLFGALAVDLYNLIATRAVPRRCQNETCRGWFVNQRGGAQHGQHRTKGVKYCTPRCARAQANREYRRRGGQRS